MMNIILYNSDYHADQIKLYPTYIVEWTLKNGMIKVNLFHKIKMI